MTGAKRKDQLKAMFGGESLPDQQQMDSKEKGKDLPAPPAGHAPRAASGAVKAMGLSLGELSKEIETARKLKESLGAGDRIVELSAELIDASFVEDRLSGDNDRDFDALVASVKAHGQQVPILVRPHPERRGRFQAAYGHRRLRAAKQLGVGIRAIVRPLNDDELVLAQGKENSERRDLSFIERALFAHTLMRKGFDRRVVQDVLSLHKAEMTRFLQVAENVPEHIVRAIGAAPKVGRPRWMALGEMLKSEAARVKAQDEITSSRFQAGDSDRRFQMLFARLASKRKPAEPDPIVDGQGRAVARARLTGKKPVIEFVEDAAPGFADYVAAEIPRLLQLYGQADG